VGWWIGGLVDWWIGGDKGNLSAGRKACPSATMLPLNLTWTDLGHDMCLSEPT
jgi:hypothetical protein